MGDLHTSWNEARGRLLPVLRQVVEPPQAWRVALADPSLALVRRPVLPMLHALCVLETDDQRAFVSQQMLDDWGARPDEVFVEALGNLAKKATRGLKQRLEYGLWQLDADDGLASSRLLLGGWLAGFRGTVPGNPIAIVPAPRILLVGGDGAPAQVERMLRLGSEAFRTAAQGLSPVVYTVDEGQRVVPWAGPGPLGAEAVASQRLLDVVCYAAQRDQLAGTVPEHLPVVQRVRVGDAMLTQCTWENRPSGTLLPEVDRVRIGDQGPVVAFASVKKTARGVLEPLPLDPPRYRARWPSDAVRRRLEAVALPEVD